MMLTTTVETFRALGTDVHVSVRDPRDLRLATALARTVLRDVDEVCSRFRDDSDLAAVNRNPGEWVPVDPLLVSAVTVACQAARATDGLVNPLLGRSLVHLGYDRDFTLLREVDGECGPSPSPHRNLWHDIGLDPDGAVRIPPNTALDLGATGKAWAADLIAVAHEEELRGASLVSVGGDLRISAASNRPWAVAVSERPGTPAEALVTLASGAMATSSTRVRRWSRRGVERHHLLDPRTGLSAHEVWRTVTATGDTCAAANTASTAAIVLGDEAPAWLRDHGVTARLVAYDGSLVTVGGWPARQGAA